MKKKVMIAQPIEGLSKKEIEKVYSNAKEYLIESCGLDVVDYYIPLSPSNIKNPPLWFMSKLLEIMSECDAVYFIKGWDRSRRCKIEQKAAKYYGLELLYEDPADDDDRGVRNRDIFIILTVLLGIGSNYISTKVFNSDPDITFFICISIIALIFFILWISEIVSTRIRRFMNSRFSRKK